MINLGELVASVKVDTKQATSSLKNFGNSADFGNGKLGNLNGKLKLLAGGLAIGAAAIGAATVAMGKYAKKVAEAGDKIDKQSQKLNVSAKEYQTLQLATDHCGISMTSMIKGTTKAMDAGYGSIYDFLEHLETIPDAAKRAEEANRVLGTRAANELAPLLKSKDGISAYRKELEKMGYMSDKAVKNSAAYQDAVASLQQAFKGFGGTIAETVLPAMTQLITGITNFYTENKEEITTILNIIGTVFGFVFNTIGAVLKGVFKQITNIINGVRQRILFFTSVVKAIKNGFNSAISGVKAFASSIGSIISKISSAYTWASKLWSKLTGADEKATSVKAKGHRVGISEVPYDNYLAVLHKGEAVLTASETNQMANGGGSGSAPVVSGGHVNVVFNLDGQTLGQSAVDFINGQTIEFNASPLLV